MATVKFVIVILVCSAVVSSEREKNCYCIVPSNSSSLKSCSDGCSSSTLQSFAENSTQVKNYSTVYFLPGTHLMSSIVLNLTNLTHITLTNYSTSSSYGTSSKVTVTVDCSGTNSGFYFHAIEKLSIIGIVFNRCGYNISCYFNAIFMHYVTDLHMNHVEIHKSRGVGFYGYEIVGTSNILNTIVNSSSRVTNSISNCLSASGNMHFYYEYKNTNSYRNHSLQIINSTIINGNNSEYLSYERPHAGGIYIYLDTSNAIHILMKNVTMSGNSGYNGGNAALDYIAYGNSWLSDITIHDCRFLNGLSRGFGAGLHAAFIAVYNMTFSHNTIGNNTLVLHVTDSHFKNNTAQKVGAGAYIQFHESVEYETVANVIFNNSHFTKNYIQTVTGRGGSAVNMINFRIPDYMPHHQPQYIVSFISCTFDENSAYVYDSYSTGSSAFYVEEIMFANVKDCFFRKNRNCSGISAVQSNLLLDGLIEISNNMAVNGGGIVLCEHSILQLSRSINVTIRDNIASQYGGGIYTEGECLQAILPCFFQLKNISNHPQKSVYLLNNRAGIAGSALYGGSVDNCYYYGPYSRNRGKIFNNTFQIDPNDSSSITSNPMRVCLCTETNSSDCNRRTVNRTVYSGGQFHINAVVVGQRDGPVPGVLMAQLDPVSGVDIMLGKLQDSQVINSTACEKIKYTVNSNVSTGIVSMTLYIKDGDKKMFTKKDRVISVAVQVLPCPPGFAIHNKQCQCQHRLRELSKIDCTITTTSIIRYVNSKWWVGFIKNANGKNTTIFSKYCPFDYCVSSRVAINTAVKSSENSQCKNNRQGILCGACQKHFSVIMGSNKCWDCRHVGFLRILGVVLLMVLLGCTSVLVIGILDLNVSEGTLNAIVFYMNVVRVNTVYFETSKDTFITTTWLKVFVAWMNLDWDFDMCFYNGMTAMGKTALVFVFPFYLWCLAGLIIYLGRKYDIVVKLFGKNTVKVLATIIFHSYAKLIRNIIDVYNRTAIIDADTNVVYRHVWTLDGNQHYLQGSSQERSALFAFATIVAAVTLPYTLALLFIQCLRKRSNMRVFFWVNKLKPFFDAYTGPYKDKYHFWTGFLLMVRLTLFIGIAVNTVRGPALNLALITAVSALLLLIIQPGIYRNRALNIIEAFTYFNLILFTTLTSYDMASNNYPTLLCVGSMFLLFCGVVAYHIIIKLTATHKWGALKVWLLDRRWPWMKQKPIRSLILPYIDPDTDEESDSGDELDPLLENAPPVARYNEYREPLIESEKTD